MVFASTLTTVTGRDPPSSVKTRVIPCFFPINPKDMIQTSSRLICTSTPAANSNLVNASKVFSDGSMISSVLLWVLISYWSRASLSLWGEVRMVVLCILTGKGIGPLTIAPVRFTVSTISFADLSMSLWSKAFNLILMLWFCTILFPLHLRRVKKFCLKKGQNYY